VIACDSIEWLANTETHHVNVRHELHVGLSGIEAGLRGSSLQQTQYTCARLWAIICTATGLRSCGRRRACHGLNSPALTISLVGYLTVQLITGKYSEDNMKMESCGAVSGLRIGKGNRSIRRVNQREIYTLKLRISSSGMWCRVAPVRTDV
jgi:hypothetical protein